MPMPAQRPAYTSDLSDEEWRILAPLLPPEKPGGRPRKYPHEAAPPTLGGGHRCANGEDYGKGGPHGSDAAKKFNGRKPHLLLDTTGFLLRVLVHPAHLRDAEMAPCHLVAAYETGERLQHIWADMAIAVSGSVPGCNKSVGGPWKLSSAPGAGAGIPWMSSPRPCQPLRSCRAAGW